MQTENIKTQYEPRILALLNQIKTQVEAATSYRGSDPFEMTDEEYRWDMVFEIEGRESIGIAFTITESECREGTDDGIAFMLDIVGEGGRVLGGFSPYNYTEELWIALDQPDAIEARFAMFEQLNIDSIVEVFKTQEAEDGTE